MTSYTPNPTVGTLFAIASGVAAGAVLLFWLASWFVERVLVRFRAKRRELDRRQDEMELEDIFTARGWRVLDRDASADGRYVAFTVERPDGSREVVLNTPDRIEIRLDDLERWDGVIPKPKGENYGKPEQGGDNTLN